MDPQVRLAPSTITLDEVCTEQELSRILGRVYAILLNLAEKETAGPGDQAANQAPEPAVTDIALQESDG